MQQTAGYWFRCDVAGGVDVEEGGSMLAMMSAERSGGGVCDGVTASR